MHLSLPKWFPLFILASSICWSLQCLISALTQGGGGGHFFKAHLLVQSYCGEGGTLQTNITGLCGECLQCFVHTEFALAHGVCAFPVYTAQALGSSAGELSEAGPGLRTLPKSKPLWVRFLGTPQRCRLCWACVLCPSQVQAAQMTKCLVSAVAPSLRLCLIAFPIPVARFSGCTMFVPSQVCHVSLLGS